MIPYGKQIVDRKDIQSVVDVLKSDWLTQGPKVKEFESALARYCGARYAVVVSNGTAALHLAYVAAGLSRGDEVVTTPNTFAATTNMLLAIGAHPVFCDIRLDTYNLDESNIEKFITRKTKAIVAVHFAGQPCDMKKIYRIARKYELRVIEDAAHALGARQRQSTSGEAIKIGSCRYSDMTTFSFHPVKPITTAEGGAVMTNNRSLYEKLLLLRSHGIYKDASGKNVMVELGYNYRLTDIQSALGLSQLKKLDRFIGKRRQVARWYKDELRGEGRIILPQEAEGNYSGWHMYVMRIKKQKNKETKKQRNRLMEYLKKQGIGVNFHYPAVYSHPYYRQHGYKNLTLANEEEYQQSCITLPLYPQLTKKEVKYISDQIKFFFNHGSV